MNCIDSISIGRRMLVCAIIFIIYSNALSKRKDLAVYYSRSSILVLLCVAYITYDNLYVFPLKNGVALYGGLLTLTPLTQVFTIFILLVSAVIILYNSFHAITISSKIMGYISTFLSKHEYKEITTLLTMNSQLYKMVEYPLVILFVICGAVFLMMSADLISMFIAIELQSYGLYILCAMHRDSEQATSGALMYFLLGGISSCFILLGSALLYINSGTSTLDGLYVISSLSNIASPTEIVELPYPYKIEMKLPKYTNSDIYFTNTNPAKGIFEQIVWPNESINKIYTYNILPEPLNIVTEYRNLGNILSNILYQDKYKINVNIYMNYINLSFIIMIVGFLFKVSGAPFHFWSPDVYDAIPTTVTTYVAIIAKLSIFILLLVLVCFVPGSDITDNGLFSFTWKNTILLSSILSLSIGSLLGLTQFRIKRLLAYSTINHVGFILLSLGVNTTESIQAYLFYILSYTISNLNVFIILVTIGYTMYLHVYKEGDRTNYGNTSDKVNNTIDLHTTNENVEKPYINYNMYPTRNEASSSSSSKIYKEIEEIDSRRKEIISHDMQANNINNTIYYRFYISVKNMGLKDTNNSPIQLINQLKGFFYLNPYLSISLTITLFSFIGIPPLLGFFAKQMVLSAALDNGLIFITLIGVITSVIGAAYYLNIVKEMFFYKSDYVTKPLLFIPLYKKKSYLYSEKQINISSALCIVISCLTLVLLLFVLIPNEMLKIAKILTLLLFF